MIAHARQAIVVIAAALVFSTEATAQVQPTEQRTRAGSIEEALALLQGAHPRGTLAFSPKRLEQTPRNSARKPPPS